MAVGELDKITNKATEWLKIASERLKVPGNYIALKYQEDVDLLAIRLTNGKSTYSRDDMDKGVIYNYDETNELVSIEILDLYGIFTKV